MSKIAAQVGTTSNSYRVLATLAVGGMAEIFLVRSAAVTGAERYCVLKRMLPEHAADPQFVQMFLDEAQLATLLQHPNIASAYDIGMLDDQYFYTMEYVHGETVRALMHRAQELDRPVPLACVLTTIAGAAAGLHHAHERNTNDGRPLGIVHRDVSPSNLMVSYEGNIKLVDFGVAKASNRALETRSGTVKGKIGYLSPEQCRGERVDRCSDLFSLGIVMWEMLTGVRLYRRETDFESMTAIVNEAPQRPSSLRSEVSRDIDAIVLRLLAKSVEARFQTAAEVVEAIENASIRAGTALSTAALGRLMHNIFGRRAEPWCEFERGRVRSDSLVLVSRPIPVPLELARIQAGPKLAAEPSVGRSSVGSTLAHLPYPAGRAFEASPPAPGGGEPVTLSVDVSDSMSSFMSDPAPLPGGPTQQIPAPASRSEATAAQRMHRLPAVLAAWSRTPRASRRVIATTSVAVVTAAAIMIGVSGRWEHLQAEVRREPVVVPSAPSEPVVSGSRAPQGSRKSTDESREPESGSAAPDRPAADPGESGTRTRRAPAQGQASGDEVEAGRGPTPQEAITIAIDSEPAGALIVVDGRVIGATPFRGRLARRDREIRFVIRKPGYTEQVVIARRTRPISQHVVLGRDATPSPPERDRSLNPF